MLSIGDMSRRTGVKIPTIRYYEQMKLIEAPERSEGGQRRYSKAELQRLGFIKHARDLGLTIEVIRKLIDLSTRPDMSCAEADQIASEHLAYVQSRIAKLKRLEIELKRISSCCNSGNIGDCYVIHALLDHSLCEDVH